MSDYTNYTNEIRLQISAIGCDKNIVTPQTSFILLTNDKSENKLDRCLTSILTQTYQDFELIILDNDSKTFTYSILDVYSNDKRIKVVKVSDTDGDFSVETALKYVSTNTVIVVKDNSVLPRNYLLNAIANNKLMKLPAINYNKIFNSIKTSDKNKYTQPMTEPVDLVYLWVNNNDEAWQKRKQEFDKLTNSCDKDSVADCRFIDNDELKYSLRSVEKNLSWINKIFIITDNQKPSWLNTENEKIKIINHSEIIPNDKLPLYNSCAIETRIPYIEELSEFFIYANDDMFFWSPLSVKDFFKEHKPIYQAGKKIANKKYKHLYGYTVTRAFKLIKEKFGCNAPYFSHHNADPYRKTLCLKCEKEFQEEYNNTLNNRFRDFSDIQRSLIMYYSISQKEAILNKDVNNLFTKIFLKKTPISLTFNTEPSKLDKIKNANCKLLCLNDSRKTTSESRRKVREILEEKFGQKSQFEK